MKSLPASLSKVKILPQTMRCILTLIQVRKIFYTTLKLLLVIVVDDGAGSKRTDDQLDHVKRYSRQVKTITDLRVNQISDSLRIPRSLCG